MVHKKNPDEFLLEINKEQAYQHSGFVDDSQISALGKQFGVDLVCIANITLFKDSYYLQVRLIDVENANVISTARETSTLEDLTEIINVSERLASSIIKENKEEVPTIYNREYSTYLKSNDPNVFLSRIEQRNNYTIVYFKYTAESSNGIYINSNCYILDKETQYKYKLLSANNIVVSNGGKLTYPEIGEILEFQLYFEPIANSTKTIDIIEQTRIGFNFYNINLVPFTSAHEHVFLDYAEEILNNIIDKLTYNLIITNTHSSPRNIYIEGEYIGTVDGYAAKSFRIPIKLQGYIESIQASGYIVNPNKEYGNISGVKANKTITIKF